MVMAVRLSIGLHQLVMGGGNTGCAVKETFIGTSRGTTLLTPQSTELRSWQTW